MTPRFDTSSLGNNFSGRGKKAADLINASRIIDLIDLIMALKDPKHDHFVSSLGGMTQYYTARYGGIHIINHLANAQAVFGHVINEGTNNARRFTAFYRACVVVELELDRIKIKDDLISWRISALDKAQLVDLEAKYAAVQHREPLDFFASSYVRKLDLVAKPRDGIVDAEAKTASLLNFIHEDFPEIFACGEPLEKPEEFFI